MFNKTVWIAIFYVMSPYFPGNNFLELALIGSIVGFLSPFLPSDWDLGIVRIAIYIFYNAIAVIGLYLLQKNNNFFTTKNLIEISVVVLILFVSGYIPEPLGTIFLVVVGFYFLLKNYTYNDIITFIKSTKRKK